MFPTLSGSRLDFIEEQGIWELCLSIDYDVPSELQKVEEGMNVDIKKDSISTLMKKQEKKTVLILEEHFQIKVQNENEDDYNFTIPFPPILSTMRDKDGILRLKTKEEKKKIKVEFPSLRSMIEADENLLADGIYEFKGEEISPE